MMVRPPGAHRRSPARAPARRVLPAAAHRRTSSSTSPAASRAPAPSSWTSCPRTRPPRCARRSQAMTAALPEPHGGVRPRARQPDRRAHRLQRRPRAAVRDRRRRARQRDRDRRVAHRRARRRPRRERQLRARRRGALPGRLARLRPRRRPRSSPPAGLPLRGARARDQRHRPARRRALLLGGARGRRSALALLAPRPTPTSCRRGRSRGSARASRTNGSARRPACSTSSPRSAGARTRRCGSTSAPA